MSDDRERTDEELADEPDDTIITCWCGASGTVDELFSFADAADGCGGAGMIQCFCGGDFCVCHHHGEYECPGCDECLDRDDSYDYGDDWDESDD